MPAAHVLRSGPLLGYRAGRMAFKSRPYHKALELQELVLAAAKKETTTPSALAQLARAWAVLEEQKRILRMKPKPKDIDVDPRNHKPKRAVVSQVLELRDAVDVRDEDGAAGSKPPDGS